MTRETKLGLVVSGSLLCLFGALLGQKLLKEKSDAPAADEAPVVVSGSPKQLPTEPLPDGSDGSKIPEPGKFPSGVTPASFSEVSSQDSNQGNTNDESKKKAPPESFGNPGTVNPPKPLPSAPPSAETAGSRAATEEVVPVPEVVPATGGKPGALPNPPAVPEITPPDNRVTKTDKEYEKMLAAKVAKSKSANAPVGPTNSGAVKPMHTEKGTPTDPATIAVVKNQAGDDRSARTLNPKTVSSTNSKNSLPPAPSSPPVTPPVKKGGPSRVPLAMPPAPELGVAALPKEPPSLPAPVPAISVKADGGEEKKKNAIVPQVTPSIPQHNSNPSATENTGEKKTNIVAEVIPPIPDNKSEPPTDGTPPATPGSVTTPVPSRETPSAPSKNGGKPLPPSPPSPVPVTQPNATLPMTVDIKTAQQDAEASEPLPSQPSKNVPAKPMNPPPPVGAAPAVEVQPMDVHAPPPNNKPAVKVTEYLVETHWVTPETLSFPAISKKFYRHEKYAQALLHYNRDHPNAVASLQADPPKLNVGQPVYIPSLALLESRYAAVIKDHQPLKTTPAIDVRPPVVAQTPKTNVAVRPVAPPQPKSVAPNPSSEVKTSQGDATGRIYVVQGAKEMLFEIARNQLGDSRRWSEIYRLNPQINPAFPIPQGTRLRLPTSARPIQ